jgi:hypothetical protein
MQPFHRYWSSGPTSLKHLRPGKITMCYASVFQKPLLGVKQELRQGEVSSLRLKKSEMAPRSKTYS